MLYERTALLKQPDALIRQELAILRSQSDVTPALVLKDPYVLDFLEPSDRFLDRDKTASCGNSKPATILHRPALLQP